jgi:hypothetical protein
MSVVPYLTRQYVMSMRICQGGLPMNLELYGCLEERMAFGKWFEDRPLLIGRAAHLMRVLNEKFESADVRDMVEVRDAAAALRLMAEEGQFYQLVTLFYQAYEQACRALAYYV